MVEKAAIDFNLYPDVGGDDWQYAFQTAVVRALEPKMLSKGTLLDMANSASFEDAIDLLAGGEYAIGQGSKAFSELSNVLHEQRFAIRKQFTDLMSNEEIVKLFKSRDDFSNMRLALRRTLTEKPLGTDYSSDGNVGPETFEEIFEQENYSKLPDYMAEAVERAVLGYYQSKDIRRIDHEIDAAQAEYNLSIAQKLKSIFLLGLFRIQLDLINIRTLLRLKFTESEQRDVFLNGGYIGPGQLNHGLGIDYDALAPLFLATPYHQVIEAGANYLASDKSFLVAERHCDDHLIGYLKMTSCITAGPQPIVAYLLMKENEIRTVRLILTAKKNALDTKLILDRIS